MRATGIIPARAGFTAADHARALGGRGSSPLARGLPIIGVRASAGMGIIPARAGFTTLFTHSAAYRADHPRSRGVYADHVSCALGGRRIIPARAGFTGRRLAGVDRCSDHPRSRGVYKASRTPSSVRYGSSPLARGLPASVGSGTPKMRIIPARAGFTHVKHVSREGTADHPRSRGVYSPRCPHPSVHVGSSPLARGLPAAHAAVERERRIIPARAGFTLADRWYPNEPVVYQTPAAFTADPGPAPPGRRSVAVVRGGASPLPDVLDATRPPRVFPAPVREPLRHAQTSGSVIRLEADRVDRADPHRHERGDDPRQGSDPGCRHQSDERGGHGEGRVVRHRDI